MLTDILEGNLTNSMEKKYTEARDEVLQDIQHAMTNNINGENKATAFLKYQSAPLLCEKVDKNAGLSELITS